MSPRLLAGYTAGILAFCGLVAWLLAWPLERAVLLAPVFVIGIGGVIGMGIIWGKAALESLRAARRPRLVVAFAVAIVLLIVVLGVLGVELPREGG
ncbi:MAG: hypothetical protein ACR2MU_00665 [Gaiellaceae bacterium]